MGRGTWAAPAPAGGWRRLKRKSIPGNSISHPSLYLLLVKLVKPFCWMLLSYLQWPGHTYLALGGVRIRLPGNGINQASRSLPKNYP
jgi:hypothetical protein